MILFRAIIFAVVFLGGAPVNSAQQRQNDFEAADDSESCASDPSGSSCSSSSGGGGGSRSTVTDDKILANDIGGNDGAIPKKSRVRDEQCSRFYRGIMGRDPSNLKRLGLLPSPSSTRDGVDWGYTFKELYRSDLTGQNAIVTGGNSGIGYEISLALARLGASVTLACRDPQRCLEAAETIEQDPRSTGKVTPMGGLELSSLQSVKEFARTFLQTNDTLDILFLNAGIGSKHKDGDATFPLSVDGVELVFATNVLGHHLLYKLLEPALQKSPLARVVYTSSCRSLETIFEHKVGTDIETLNGQTVTSANARGLYAQSKLAQILWAKHLTRKLGPDSSIYVNAGHPGMVNTPLWERSKKDYYKKHVRCMWTAEEGALTLLYLGVATDQLSDKNIRGRYFHPQAVEVVNPLALDEDLQKDLWAFCDDLVKDFV